MIPLPNGIRCLDNMCPRARSSSCNDRLSWLILGIDLELRKEKRRKAPISLISSAMPFKKSHPVWKRASYLGRFSIINHAASICC